METNEQKGVLRPPILASKLTNSNQNYNLSDGDNSLYQSRETYSNSVSRPPECDIHYNGQVENYSSNPKKFILNPPADSLEETHLSGGATGLKAVQELKRKVKACETITTDMLVDGRFIPPHLLRTLIDKHSKKVALVLSGLGTGKSWSLSKIMQEANGGRGVASCHRIGLSEQLGRDFVADNYRAVLHTGGELSDRLAITVHSLPRGVQTERTSRAFDGGMFVIDESNSVAAEINNATIKNEALTIQAIGEAINKSAMTVCADAHLDLSTVDLLAAAGVSADDMLLIVVDRPELQGYTVRIWEDETGADGKPATKAAFMNQILADVRNDLKVIVTSLSATFLEELNREAEKQSIGDGYGGKLLITGNTPVSVREELTADSYQDYKLVMLSPSMSTGISFNKTILQGGKVINCPDYQHADRSYVVLSNSVDTGGFQDGLQAMMRERAVNNSTVNCYYAESPVPLPPVSRIARHAANEIEARKAAFDELAKYVPDDVDPAAIWKKHRPAQDAADTFMLSQALRTGEQKRDFLNLFIEQCEAKGATVERCELAALADGEITFKMLQEEKQREREAWKQDRIDAMKLVDDDVDNLDESILKPAQDRQYIEQQCVADFDQMEPNERGELIDLVYPESGKSILQVAREVERSQTDEKMLADIVSAAMLGVSGGEGDTLRFLEKSSTDKKHWFNRAKYTRLVMKAAGISLVDDELMFTDSVVLNSQEVRKRGGVSSGLFYSLKQNPKPAIMCGLIKLETNPDEVKANPLPFIIDMMAGLGIKTRKVRKKQEWSVQADSFETVLAMVNRRKGAGINEQKEWLDLINEYIESYHARKSAQNERDAGNRTKAPDNVTTALSDALDHVERPELLADAIQYFEPFHSRIKAGKLSKTMLSLMVKKWLDNSAE